jgi:hypothetical protein
MSQSAVLTKRIAQAPSCDEIAPTIEQVICIHPLAEKSAYLYYFLAVIANKDRAERRQALVICPVDSLASVNRAIWAELDDRWFCTQFRVAA